MGILNRVSYFCLGATIALGAWPESFAATTPSGGAAAIIGDRLAISIGLTGSSRDAFVSKYISFAARESALWSKECEIKAGLAHQVAIRSVDDDSASKLLSAIRRIQSERIGLESDMYDELNRLAPAHKVILFADFRYSDLSSRKCMNETVGSASMGN